MNSCKAALSVPRVTRAATRPVVPLTHSVDGKLAHGAAAGMELLVPLLVLFQPPEICIIDLDRSGHLGQIIVERLSNVVGEKPGGFSADPEITGELEGRDSLGMGTQQIARQNPCHDNEARVRHEGPGLHR